MNELGAILLSVWGVVTAVLCVLLIYRSMLASKEEDRIFIDSPEQHHFQMAGAKAPTDYLREQQEIVAKISRLAKPILALAVTSAVLLLASIGIWAFHGM